MAIKNKEIKKLYGNSAGRCNICFKKLIEKNVHIGEMAHIIAESPKGPRGDDLPPDNTYNNLILLCPNHHSEVDDNPDFYPVDKLKKIKEDFEKRIDLRLDITKDYETDLSSLNMLFKHIPIKDFRAMAINLPNKVSIHFNAREEFTEFYIKNPHLYPFYDMELTNYWEIFLEKLDCINDWKLGSITNKKNELVTFYEMLYSTDFSKQGFNVYVTCDYDYDILVLNKRYLSPIQLEVATKKIAVLQQEFIYAHTALINYIRYNYKEIEW